MRNNRLPIGIFALAIVAVPRISHATTCNPCVPGSGCEPQCIDNGAHNPPIEPFCSCGQASDPHFPVCQSPLGNFQFQVTVAAGQSTDYDATADIPGFKMNVDACPGYAMCETGFSGSGDSWDAWYQDTNTGHWHWTVGSMGPNGGPVTAVSNAWPVIGTEYNSDGFGCGGACKLASDITVVTAQPGSGTNHQTAPYPVPSAGAFHCIMGREGDLGQTGNKGSINIYTGGFDPVAYATSPSTNTAYSYLEMLTLYRPGGHPVTMNSLVSSITNGNVLMGTNCGPAGFDMVAANNEDIFWSPAGSGSAYLAQEYAGTQTKGACMVWPQP